MGPEELGRLIKHALAVTLLFTAVIWCVSDTYHAVGFAFGGLWSSVNLWALKGLIEEIFQSRRLWFIALFAQLKLPILYGIGALILITVPLSIVTAVCGFNVPFILIVVESIYYQRKEQQSEEFPV